MPRPTLSATRGLLLALALPGLAAVPAPAQEAQLSGWLHVLWADGQPGAEPTRERYVLVDDAGRATELLLEPGGVSAPAGVLSLNRRRVTITGRRADAGTDGLALFRASSLRAEPTSSSPTVPGARFSVAASAQSGSKPFVTILCRFADSPRVEPRPRSTYEQWLGNAYPGMDHYWREASEGRAGVTGSAVHGWYTLPHPRSHYVSGGKVEFARLVDDCTGVADAEVHFPAYTGVNLQFNQELAGYSYGGSWTLVRDGQSRNVGMTWMASWATPMTYAHEAGHSFGLPHSSGPYAATYDSRWDPMSAGGFYDAAHATHIANHPIAFHKDLLGWIAPERKYVAEAGTTRTVVIERSAQSPAGNYRMAQIPIPGTRHFYTVEARLAAGYDRAAGLPAEGVVLHRVDPSLADRAARVVDADGNGNPNDAGAVWTPGETFTDAAAGISVAVEAATATGFRVRISVAAPPLTAERMMDHLLGTRASLTDDEVRFLDQQGNHNGRLDLGDVQVWMQKNGIRLPS